MIFKTPCQTERETRDLAIYNEYNALIAVEGQSKTLVTEHLSKHSVKSIFYAIYQILTFAHVNLYLKLNEQLIIVT